MNALNICGMRLFSMVNSFLLYVGFVQFLCVGFVTPYYYTLNLKCMMSPSCTTYSFPSTPSLPASRTAASEPYLM